MSEAPLTAGTLFVVATPIGNLEDLTFRALRTLKEVDVVAAEDTRRTRKLLTHYGLATPLVSLHTHNEHTEAPRLVERLCRGQSVAVVSDAGTPGISDPGATIVRLAREAGVRIVPIPGPSALTAALSVSGLAFDSFTFLGFAPATGSARSAWLRRVADEPGVVVFFEAPHRVAKLRMEIDLFIAKRPIFLMRELTKAFEELAINTNMLSVERDEGEFVVIVGEDAHETNDSVDANAVVDLFGRMTQLAGIGEADAFVAVSAIFELKPSKVRSLVKKARFAKHQSEQQSDGSDHPKNSRNTSGGR